MTVTSVVTSCVTVTYVVTSCMTVTSVVRQTEAEMKRQKLDYEEMTPCLKQVTRVWDEMLCTPEGVKINTDVIQDAVREGKLWWFIL